VLTIITTSVGYGDYLSLTLPQSIKFGQVIVATYGDDSLTLDVARKHEVIVHTTDAWYKEDSAFNKGAGINSALDMAASHGLLDDWLLLLDADILMLPRPPDSQPVENLDQTYLYGVRRRMCRSLSDLSELQETKGYFDLPCAPLPYVVRGGRGRARVWGGRATSNPVGLQGYFQLWHYPSYPRRMFEHKTAAKYDVKLAMTWPDSQRVLIPWRDYSVLHLGERKKNWNGRVTPYWEVAPLDYDELERLSRDYYG